MRAVGNLASGEGAVSWAMRVLPAGKLSEAQYHQSHPSHRADAPGQTIPSSGSGGGEPGDLVGGGVAAGARSRRAGRDEAVDAVAAVLTGCRRS